MGGVSIDKYGEPLTEETLEAARKSDAVLLGAVGGRVGVDSWYKLPPHLRPEAGLLSIRKGLGLFANLRPAYLYPELKNACPLRESIAEQGFDMIVVRELTGGLYFGKRETKEIDGVMTAVDTLTYNENEIRRIVKKALSPLQLGRQQRLPHSRPPLGHSRPRPHTPPPPHLPPPSTHPAHPLPQRIRGQSGLLKRASQITRITRMPSGTKIHPDGIRVIRVICETSP